MKRDMKKNHMIVHIAWISVSVVTLAMLIIGLFIIVSAWGIVSFICTTVACSSARP
jgi:uncharacterized membrane protein